MKRPACIKVPPNVLDYGEEGDTWEDLELDEGG
jgi:hypothetical protein